jgi:hypothetical protein
MSIKNPNDTIGNRTRELPACSAVPQPTALPPFFVRKESNFLYIILINVGFQRANQTWGQNYVHVNNYEEFEGVGCSAQWLHRLKEGKN